MKFLLHALWISLATIKGPLLCGLRKKDEGVAVNPESGQNKFVYHAIVI